jgi:hypothetical protein
VWEFAGRVFVEFVVEFVYLGAGADEGFAAGGGEGVEAAPTAGDAAECGLEEAGALEAVEEGVESSGTDAVAMVGELLHHGEAEDGLMRGMGQHVDADEAEVEFALMLDHGLYVNSFMMRRGYDVIEIR